jgi:NAD(P)-dependent dehydrogenase (short-subunit alcohol dehydrogenase family)
MQELAGKVAVVTGAGSGIGRALALRLGAEGMTVVIADISEGALDGTAAALREAGAAVHAVRADVARAAEVEALAERAFAVQGAVRLLCNNAGVVGRFGPVWEQTPADWDFVLGVNLYGVIHGIRAFVPRMIRQGEPAQIVNTVSEAGFTSRPYTSVYNASKHALMTLTESLADELRRAGAPIAVAALCPGGVNTGILDPARPRPPADTDDANEMMERVMRDGLAFAMEPAEVAGYVVEAVRDGRFYIFSHPEVKAMVRARMEAAAGEQTPVYNDGFLHGLEHARDDGAE